MTKETTMSQEVFEGMLRQLAQQSTNNWHLLQKLAYESVRQVLESKDLSRLDRAWQVISTLPQAVKWRSYVVLCCGGASGRNERGQFVKADNPALTYTVKAGWLYQPSRTQHKSALILWRTVLQNCPWDSIKFAPQGQVKTREQAIRQIRAAIKDWPPTLPKESLQELISALSRLEEKI